MTAHPLDIRMAHLEGAYEQISDRLNGFDTRFATIEQKIDLRFGRVDEQLAEMRKLIINGGFAIGAFVLVSILLPLVQRFL